MIVRLLIHHSECMGPALAGEPLGLHRVYTEVAEILTESDKLPTPPQNVSRSTSTLSTASSIINGVETAQNVLSFYTALLRLLAHCAMLPGNSSNSTHSHRQKENSVIRTRNILQNLVKTDDIVGILSLPYSKNGLTPGHKEVVLLFLERVYGAPNADMLQTLIMSAFLNDVKMAIKLSEVYTCIYVRLCMNTHIHMHRHTRNHTHTNRNAQTQTHTHLHTHTHRRMTALFAPL